MLPLSAPERGLGGEVFSECPWFGTSSSACCS